MYLYVSETIEMFEVDTCHGLPLFYKVNTVKPVLRDHCQSPMRSPVLKDQIFLAEGSTFNVIEPVTKDHLSWETTFVWPMRWSFKIGSTVIANR